MRHPISWRNALAAAAVASAVAAAPGTAQAQSINLFDRVGEALTAVWDSLTGSVDNIIGEAASSAGTMRIPRGTDAENEFWEMLGDAGYDMKEVTVEIGLIPGLDVTYLLKRELSDADREALDTRLEKFVANNEWSLTLMAERAIIVALLDASELGNYRVDKLKITWLPLPSATFQFGPTEGPLEEEHDRIFRAVKDISKRMSSTVAAR